MLLHQRFMMLTLFLSACSVPQEPAALKSGNSTSEGSKVSAKGSKASSAVAVNYGGASIGDDEMKADVKSCIEQGKFFDRTSGSRGSCTTYKLAEISCTDSTITSIMDENDKSDYESFKTKDLAGFTLDQCLDCSSPVGNPFCEGKNATKIKDPGTRLFHVKVNGTVVDIKTIYVYK